MKRDKISLSFWIAVATAAFAFFYVSQAYTEAISSELKTVLTVIFPALLVLVIITTALSRRTERTVRYVLYSISMILRICSCVALYQIGTAPDNTISYDAAFSATVLFNTVAALTFIGIIANIVVFWEKTETSNTGDERHKNKKIVTTGTPNIG